MTYSTSHCHIIFSNTTPQEDITSPRNHKNHFPPRLKNTCARSFYRESNSQYNESTHIFRLGGRCFSSTPVLTSHPVRPVFSIKQAVGHAYFGMLFVFFIEVHYLFSWCSLLCDDLLCCSCVYFLFDNCFFVPFFRCLFFVYRIMCGLHAFSLSCHTLMRPYPPMQTFIRRTFVSVQTVFLQKCRLYCLKVSGFLLGLTVLTGECHDWYISGPMAFICVIL